MMIGFLLLSLTAVAVSGHGNMVLPYSWFDHARIGTMEGVQCAPGCDIDPARLGGIGCACMWFTNNTHIRGDTTIFEPRLRTYSINATGPWDWTARNPWRAPGSAPLFSPCGVAGGNPFGCGEGDLSHTCHGGGYPFGPAAERFEFPDAPVTEWRLGDVVEAAWGIAANHGGGYSYRLCPKTDLVSEECFQAMPLEFVGDKSWVEFGTDAGSRVEIAATRTAEGTEPAGSMWTKNPIPACSGFDGGFFNHVANCTGTQFPAPGEGLEGFGTNIDQTVKPFRFHIVDKLQVPSTIAPGDYVLSFRWDCEQTPQVWSTCANVKIVRDQWVEPIIAIVP